MIRRKQIVLTFAVILAVTVMAGAHASPQKSDKLAPTKDSPTSETDLRKFGYVEPAANGADKPGITVGSIVGFSASNAIIFAWTTRDSGIRRDPKGTALSTGNGQLHAIVLDMTTRQETAKQDWPLPTPWAARSVISNGELAACIDKKIELFSERLEKLAEMELPAPDTCASIRYLVGSGYSSSEKSFVMFLGDASSRRVEELDANTLRVNSIHEDVVQIIATTNNQNRPPAYKEILHPNGDTTLTIEQGGMTAATPGGSVLFRTKLPANRRYGEMSSGTERFAIMEEKMKGIDSSFLDMAKFPSDDEIVVYDISEKRAIFALKVSGVFDWPPHIAAFAIAPDGKRLAVVSGGVLRIYDLPASHTTN
ncbi:MAG TPA: hypothetical protein VIH72_10345 [Candidatus Acidoferrales bacterium]|jgi:hypothetical protein